MIEMLKHEVTRFFIFFTPKSPLYQSYKNPPLDPNRTYGIKFVSAKQVLPCLVSCTLCIVKVYLSDWLCPQVSSSVLQCPQTFFSAYRTNVPSSTCATGQPPPVSAPHTFVCEVPNRCRMVDTYSSPVSVCPAPQATSTTSILCLTKRKLNSCTSLYGLQVVQSSSL